MVNKPNNVKNYYYIHYIIELATFFGDEVIEQCRNLGYELKLPKDVEKINFKDIKNMYILSNIVMAMMMILMTSYIDC